VTAGGDGFYGGLRLLGLCLPSDLDAHEATGPYCRYRQQEEGWARRKAAALQAKVEEILSLRRAEKAAAAEAAAAAAAAAAGPDADPELESAGQEEKTEVEAEPEALEEEENVEVPFVPEDCEEVPFLSLPLGFGTGLLPSGLLLVPSSAAPGRYVLEVADDVAEAAILPAGFTASAAQAMPSVPELVAGQARVARRVPPASSLEFVVTVPETV
jgi:hypothetical protein